MVAAGWAMTYRDEKYAKSEQNAQLGKRGIWQGKFMRPALYRALERIKQNANPL
jgi:endonuclease YncB( thermonuclease family)